MERDWLVNVWMIEVVKDTTIECFNCLVCDKRLADEEGNYPYWTYGDGVFCSECGMEQLKRWREVQNVTVTETDDSDRNIRA